MQLASSGQRPDNICLLPVGGDVGLAKPFDAFSADFDSRLAQKLVRPQDVEAGRRAYLSGLPSAGDARASSPLTGFLDG